MSVPVQPVERIERRLAAILAADVVGYSRLMGNDEVGTLERLKAHRSLLIDPKIREHHGRIVKTTGDGMLVEFGSVVDAVSCAVEMQRGMVDRNTDMPEDQRILWRIGINLGDVIIDGDDIHGDGVNVAARLEALAEPGGICVSRMVHDQVRDKLPYSFDDMGEQSVKNIARPVRADALSAATVATTPLVPTQRPPQPGPARRSVVPGPAVIAASVGVLIVIGLGGWWMWPHVGPSPASVQAPAAKPAPRLSIVVLPFTNLSNDPEQEFFADGVTDDLTTDLTRITDSFVISRTTAFTYRGKAIDVKQIGKDLGVRYALEGSVRRVGQQVQANVQLIDTETGAHVWADRLEADRADLAKAQDAIVGRLANALKLEIVEAAVRRIELERPVNPEASDFVMRGWALYYRPISTPILLEAQAAFERALALDPQSVDAKIGLATVLTEFVANGRAHVVDGATVSRDQDLAHSDQLLAEAMAHGTESARAYFATARLRRLQNRLIESRIELEKGIVLDRNHPGIILQLGITLLFLGQPEAALPQFEKALELNSRYGNPFFYQFWLGYCHLLMAQTDEAIDSLRKARAANPEFPPNSLFLAVALGFKGDIDEAKAALAEAHKLRPEWDSFAKLSKGNNWNGSPQFVALREKTLDVGLRRAGLPEE
jgi:adenylate cyclase